MNFGTLLYQFTIDLMIKIVNLTDILYESLFWSIKVIMYVALVSHGTL